MAHLMEEHLDMPLRDVLCIIQDRVMNGTTYFGVRALKSPTDSWIYQELIFETKPDVIVEIGNADGGSTLLLAHMCDLLDHGRVIAVDSVHSTVPDHVRKHPRITWIEGDACRCIRNVSQLISEDEDVLIIEDSSHTYENTLNVLRHYSALIRPGGYFVVEDGICHHGLCVGPKPGPYEAVEAFVRENDDFQIDRSREAFLITWNPKGYLRRGNPEERTTPLARPRLRPRPRGGSRSSARTVLKLLLPPILVQMLRGAKEKWRTTRLR